jgi:hypothetical protein
MVRRSRKSGMNCRGAVSEETPSRAGRRRSEDAEGDGAEALCLSRFSAAEGPVAK